MKEIINDSTDGLTFYSQPAMTVDAADLKQLYPMVKTPQWFQSYQDTMGNHGCKETIFQVGNSAASWKLVCVNCCQEVITDNRFPHLHFLFSLRPDPHLGSH